MWYGIAVHLDQTPTPTRFLRNCEETGLFQELGNPFEQVLKEGDVTCPFIVMYDHGSQIHVCHNMYSFPKIFKSSFCLGNDLNTHENIQTIFPLATCIQQCRVWTFDKYYRLASMILHCWMFFLHKGFQTSY